MKEVESVGRVEKFAKDLEGCLGLCSLPRSDFFALLWKDNWSPQLRVLPAWGSPQMAKLASKLTSHSTGYGGGGPSPADGGRELLWEWLPESGVNLSCANSAQAIGWTHMHVNKAASFLPPPSVLFKGKFTATGPHRSDIVFLLITVHMTSHWKRPPVWLLKKDPGLEMSAVQNSSLLSGLPEWEQ